MKNDNTAAINAALRQALSGHGLTDEQMNSAIEEGTQNAKRALAKWFPDDFEAPSKTTAREQSNRAQKRAMKQKRQNKKRK